MRDRTADLARENSALTRQIVELERAERIPESLQAELRQAQKMDAMGGLPGGASDEFRPRPLSRRAP